VQTTGAGQTQLELFRPFLNSGCSNASLDGAYGFGGFGLQAFGMPSPPPSNGDDDDDDDDDNGEPPSNGGNNQSSSSGVTPFALVGRAFANAGGTFGMDAAGNNSIPNGARQLTGTYRVNDDCTGTATLMSTTGDQQTSVPVAFVLTPSTVPTAAGQISAGPPRAEIRFVFTGSTYAGSGVAR
jgi:hypothetical protein